MIDPALAHLARPIHAVQPHPRNPRQGDLGAIATSLERFGQVRPILATRDGTIIAGNHVWRAAMQLGWTEIAVVIAEQLSERDADAYLIADNRLSDLGSYDDRALASILSELAEAGNLVGTGYDGDDVDALLRRLAREDEASPEPETREGVANEWHRCPACGHEWLGPPMPARIQRDDG